MKIIHTSDWHLGRTFHGTDLSAAYAAWCDFLVGYVRREEIDAVLICGDVFDRGIPPLPAVRLLSDTLSKLLETTQVVCISGNHDAPGRLSFGSSFMISQMHFRTDPAQCADPCVLRRKNGDIGALVYGIPYLDPDLARQNIQHEAQTDAPQARPLPARSHEAVMKAALQNIRSNMTAGKYADLDVPRIVMAHTFVTGGVGSDSEADITVGGVNCVPSSLFRLKRGGRLIPDYIALGHLHGPQSVGTAEDPPMRYSGSPIALSFSEENQKKSFVRLDFPHSSPTGADAEEFRAPKISLVPVPQLRRLTSIHGTLAEITDGRYSSASDDFVRITVTDPVRPENLRLQLKKYFPYLSELKFAGAGAGEKMNRARGIKQTPLETLTDFFTIARDRPLTGEETDLLRETWEELRKGGTQ